MRYIKPLCYYYYERIGQELSMQPQDCIFYKLTKVSKSGARFWKGVVSDLGITGVQGLVLNFLYDSDSIAASELADMAALDYATLTGLVDRLESLELVYREPNPDDRRAILICLTKQGKKVAMAVRERSETANQEFLSQLSKKDVADLHRIMGKF